MQDLTLDPCFDITPLLMIYIHVCQHPGAQPPWAHTADRADPAPPFSERQDAGIGSSLFFNLFTFQQHQHELMQAKGWV
ncbi:hypothetical protein CATMQ487_22500 [Sphaerotilus microaerophilus]|uniref:Uncharacterized protein n=2 Tax=Sphaerotilus microaerophilus TaxID=2914710 RepID=A0ABN6PPQ1_9BURK|nr:hypothetical protein CATMQ487_22500 [Sphaerotilus sp. FB-5]